MHTVLKTVFGHDEFRPHQKSIIEALMNGQDTLAILPTGAGKSLCYQLPAHLKSGITVVISPLIALMKDQVDQLKRMGLPAAYINSSLRPHEVEDIKAHIYDYKLLYISPERLMMPEFRQFLHSIDVAFFAVDEAHCISQWGHQFRPEYRQLNVLKKEFPSKAILALTATATDRVQADIIRQLQLPHATKIVGSFNRSNLTYHVRPRQNIVAQILEVIRRFPDQSGIVYTATKRSADQLQQVLANAGLRVCKYHAGLSDGERKQNQEAFIRDQVNIMVATLAFGMGINKPDVRYIIHAEMPQTIERYYQETGRAGRDGLPSECMCFFSYADVALYQFFLKDLQDMQVRAEMERKTYEMLNYCQGAVCRRVFLLQYFSETLGQDNCGACDICADGGAKEDCTEVAQKIIAGVVALRSRFGINHVIDVLVGSKAKKILDYRHDKLAAYNTLSQIPKMQLRDLIHNLIGLNILRVSQDEYPVLALGDQAEVVLKGQKPVLIRQKSYEESRPQSAPEVQDNSLFQKLRQLRRSLATQEGVPPYIIFTDVALLDMSAHYPTENGTFLNIHGVGQTKLKNYGSAFMQVIQDHCRQNNIDPGRFKKSVVSPNLARS